MKRFCQWPYLVIAILVFCLVNDRTTNSQQIQIVNSPDQPELTLTSVKTENGHRVRLSLGKMLLETDQFHALHTDGTATRISARKGQVEIAHRKSSLVAAQITLSLDNGILEKDRRSSIGN